MNKYKKGKNEEEPLDKNKIPIKGLPEDFLWMQVNPGTKMRNVLDYAMAEMMSHTAVVWSGSGPAVSKVISCAEIMKRDFPYHQVNQICFRKVKEHWDPLIEDLDPLVVIRELPTIHILLSKESVDTSQPGYQPPSDHPRRGGSNRQQDRYNKPPRRRIDHGKFESLGLRSSRTKGPKRKPKESIEQTSSNSTSSQIMKHTDNSYQNQMPGETNQLHPSVLKQDKQFKEKRPTNFEKSKKSTGSFN